MGLTIREMQKIVCREFNVDACTSMEFVSTIPSEMALLGKKHILKNEESFINYLNWLEKGGD